MENTLDWGVPDWRCEDQYPDPSAMTPTAWAWEFLRRNPKYRARWDTAPAKAIGLGDFGLLGLPPDPRQSMPTLPPPAFAAAAVREIRPGRRGEQTVTLNPQDVAIVFDLYRPVNEQLRRARCALTSLQAHLKMSPKLIRKRESEYGKYLRVLDAVDAAVSDREIATVLYSTDSADDTRKKVKDDRKAALKLRDGGYLALAGSTK